MPRASQYLLEGYTYHLTHRCHNRKFLLRFARDRDVYREWLREGVQRHGVPVYGFWCCRREASLEAHESVAESYPSVKIEPTLSDVSGGIYVVWHVSAPDGHRAGRPSMRFLDSRCVPELAFLLTCGCRGLSRRNEDDTWIRLMGYESVAGTAFKAGCWRTHGPPPAGSGEGGVA